MYFEIDESHPDMTLPTGVMSGWLSSISKYISRLTAVYQSASPTGRTLTYRRLAV